MASLEALSERSGIELSFIDALGEKQTASHETLRALLKAMGIRAETDEEVATSVETLDRRDWEQPLPPVVVVDRTAGPATVTLTLPATSGMVRWHLRLEDGAESSDAIPFEELALLDAQTHEGNALQRRRLDLPGPLPHGYHRLSLQPGGRETILIVTPGRCWLPPALTTGKKAWGVAAQLPLLRSDSNWGVGDYSDLRALVELVGAQGGDVVGLNPLHAIFADEPEHASPYSPASRLLLNIAAINVTELVELASSEVTRHLVASSDFQQRLAECRSSSSVLYSDAVTLKLQVLRQLFAEFLTQPEPVSVRSFKDFRRAQCPAFEAHCLFMALRGHFADQDRADWHSWPEQYLDPTSCAVAQFAEQHSDDVTFQVWLQWIADRQLAAAADAAGRMQIGLYRDLAVGAAPSGAETWANQRAVIADVQVGAPPDIHNKAGQDWGLPPFNPVALREEGYRSFVDLIRANMKHAGGLRIDHVMALQHVYCVPKGQPASNGAYIRYPIEDLLGVLALESERNRCLVVGEDLGTVPEGFRERMAKANVLSYRVLAFEKDEHAFLPPAQYPALALAVAGNHDLATLRGWWEASDLDLRERLGLFSSAEAAAKIRSVRAAEREQLVGAMRLEGLMPEGTDMDAERLILLAHSFLARSPAVIAMVQMDDLTAELDQVNVPTTSDEYPNWRRKLSLTLDELAAHPRFAAITRTFAAERGWSDTEPYAWQDAISIAVADLPAYLMTQRWYSAKDAGSPTMTLEEHVPCSSSEFRACIATWTAKTGSGSTQRIFLPLAIVSPDDLDYPDAPIITTLPSGELLVDAFFLDGFVRWWVGSMLGHEAALPGIDAGHTLRAKEMNLAEGAPWPVRRINAEQSNTSIRIGKTAMMKVFRSAAGGVHPELEIGHFLTEVAPFDGIPALLGWVKQADSVLSVLQAYVVNEGDGWSWILKRLEGSAEDRADALAWIVKLGERTAEMHRALATPTDDDAFRSELVVAADLARWGTEATSMLDRVLHALPSAQSSFDADGIALAAALRRDQDKVAARVEALLSFEASSSKTRHHGDYHLGQVLVRDHDAVIVDFEGEPLRSLAERRAKNSPLRDVAGMMRSIDYAAAVAARGQQDDAAALRAWAKAASEAYRESYLRAAGAGLAGEEAERLIAFFALEKALYEVAYELANRPDWVAIPLRAVFDLLTVEGDVASGA
jgi:4-alpha-glucanotransferase